MNPFDTIYIVIYNFCNKTTKPDKDDARATAITYFIALLAFSLTIISNIVGLVYDNKFSAFIVNIVGFVIFGALIGILLYLIFRRRYYKLYDVDLLQEKFYSKTKKKQRLLNYLVLLAIISILVLSFVTFRLYKFGYI